MVDRQVMLAKQFSEGFDKLATVQPVTFIAGDDGTRLFLDIQVWHRSALTS
jgi:hypothetical protein